MPKRKLPSKVRYDLAHPTISVRVSKDEYDKLDYLRVTEGKSWKDLLLDSLGECDQVVQLGKCSSCGKDYNWDLSRQAHADFLDDLVSKARPKCKKCRENAAKS